jgi:hypothetical protein
MSGADYFLFTITNTSTNESTNVQYAPAADYHFGNLVNYNPYTVTITPFVNGLQGTPFTSDLFAPPTNLNIWKDAESGAFNHLGLSVAYGNGIWVAGGITNPMTNSLKYSTDGINWQNAVSGDDFDVALGVAYGGGRFLAFGLGGSRTIKYSIDGMNWTNSSLGAFLTAGKYGAYGKDNNNNDMWLAVGEDFPGVYSIKKSLDNGATWEPAGFGNTFPSGAFGIAYNNKDTWVAVGADNSSTGRTIKFYTTNTDLNWLYSLDGKFSNLGSKVAFAEDIWIAIGSDVNGNGIRYSTDGVNWKNANNTGFEVGFCVAHGAGWWVAGGNTAGNTMKISQNGLLWNNPIINFFSLVCNGVAFDGVKRWVAVGADATSTIKYVDV